MCPWRVVKKRDGDATGRWRVLATAGCRMLLHGPWRRTRTNCLVDASPRMHACKRQELRSLRAPFLPCRDDLMPRLQCSKRIAGYSFGWEAWSGQGKLSSGSSAIPIMADDQKGPPCLRGKGGASRGVCRSCLGKEPLCRALTAGYVRDVRGI